MAIKIFVATENDKPSNATAYGADARAIFAMATVSPTRAAKVDISEESKSYVPLLKAAIKRLGINMTAEKVRGTEWLYCAIPTAVLDCDCGFCEQPIHLVA